MATRPSIRSAPLSTFRSTKTDRELAPTRLTYATAAFVRLKKRMQIDPPYLYYHRDTAGWLARGYTVWTMVEWHGAFRYQGRPSLGDREWVDPEGRLWEFFAYEIPLYDKNEVT